MRDFLEHFKFAQPQWLLLLVPCALLFLLRRGRGAEAAITFSTLSVLVSLGAKVRRTAWSFGLPLAMLALIAAIFAMARPVWRNEYQSKTASGIDIAIAFDVSLSMSIDDFRTPGGLRCSGSMPPRKWSTTSSAAAPTTASAWSSTPAGPTP